MHLHGGAPRNRVRQVPQGMSRVVDYALRREVEYERTPRVRTRKPVSYLEVDRVDGVGHEGVEVLPAPGDVTLQQANAIGNLEKSAFRVSSTVEVPNRVAMTVGQRYG